MTGREQEGAGVEKNRARIEGQKGPLTERDEGTWLLGDLRARCINNTVHFYSFSESE